MKTILVALISFLVCGEMQKSFAADFPQAQVAANGTEVLSDNPPEFLSEVVSVRYERAQAIADAFNSLGKNSSGWEASKLVCKDKMNVLSNAWEHLSERFKQWNSMRTTSLDVVTSGADRIIADERTNSLLIYASKDDLKILKDTIAQLDVVRSQILIEAVIFEISLGDPNHHHRRKRAADTGAARPPVISESNVVSTMAFAPVAVTNNSNEASNRFATVQGFKGDLDALVTELASDSGVRILQRPRIQTSDGEPATIFVGESRPYPTGSYHRFANYNTIQELQTGVTLDVDPHITSQDSLLLDIHQTVESANGSVNIANVGSVPVTSRREFQAEVNLTDRQTVLLGGLIQSVKKDYHKGIPVIGQWFRKSNPSEQSELMVAIRAMILPAPDQVAARSASRTTGLPK